MSSPGCHWCFKCDYHLCSPWEHLWLQVMEFSLSDGMCSPESGNWAQSQTLVALDAELVGISLLHENDQNLKRKPGLTKKRKLLKRLSHKKKKNLFLHLPLRKHQLLYRQNPPQRACDVRPQTHKPMGSSSTCTEIHGFKGSLHEPFCRSRPEASHTDGQCDIGLSIALHYILSPPPRALANLYFPCTKRENGYSRCL